MSDKKSPLSRWASRKQQAQQTTPSITAPDESTPLAPADKPTAATTAEAKPLTDADMPPLDTLDKDSDYQQFLSPEVSDELRRLALRKLFHQAVFNQDDGLEMYNDDFTHFEPLGDVVTHDMRRMLQVEQQREAEKAAAAEQQDNAEADAQQPAVDDESEVAESTQNTSADSSNNDKLNDSNT